MKLEKGEISNFQLAVLILSFMQSMVLTINFAYSITKHDTWIVILAALVITLLLGLLYTSIAQKFPGQNLIQINDIVFGPYIGKVITVLYLWFFLQLTIHFMYFFNSFWITYVMPETPRLAFLIMFALICAMAVRGGIEVITRCSFLLTVIVAATSIVITLLLIGDLDFTNLLPILECSPMEFLQGLHIILAISFCDIVVFLMIFPSAAKKRQIKKPMLISISLSTLQGLLVTVRASTVLGIRIANTPAASFAVSRQIEIANILTRLDILIAIALLITFFMKVSIYYYVTVLGIAQTLKLRSYLPLVVPVGILCVAIATQLYPSDMEQFYAGIYIWPFNAVIHEILLPLVTFIIMAIRRLPKKEVENFQ
ncbi:MAG: endospore germination permease [Oscillospiraceae bacterium]